MKSMTILKQNHIKRKYKAYAIIFLFFLFGISINYHLNFFVQNVIDKSLSTSVLFYSFLSILGFFILVHLFAKNPIYFFLYFIIVGCVALSGVLYPNVSLIFDNFFNPAYNKLFILLFYCLPFFFFVVEYWVDIRKSVLDYLYYFSTSCLILGLINWVFILTAHLNIEYMTFSYNLLLSVVASFCVFRIKDKGIQNAVICFLGSVGLVCVLVSGSRGCFLCCLISLLLLLFTKKRSDKKTLLIVFLLFIVAAVGLYFYDILLLLSSFFGSFSIKLRTLDSLQNGTLFESTGRNNLRDAAISGILNNIFGYGLYGDRHITGTYVHNVFLEMFLDFGLFGGSFILLYIFYSLFTALKTEDRDIVIIISSYGLFHLFFSGSFMWHLPFFCLIAIFVANKKHKHTFEGLGNNLSFPLAL